MLESGVGDDDGDDDADDDGDDEGGVEEKIIATQC